MQNNISSKQKYNNSAINFNYEQYRGIQEYVSELNSEILVKILIHVI